MSRGSSLPFDSIASVYDASRGGPERGRRFAGALSSILNASQPVLEIGVGTGLVAAGLVDAGFAVVGIDLSEPMLHVAATRIAGRIACADALGMPVADASVAQAYSVWLLHLVPADALLRETARILMAGGRYAIVSSVIDAVDPQDDAGAILNDLMRALDPDWVGGRLDGTEALAALTSGAGFRIEETGVIENPGHHSPAELIARIEARAYSRLIDLDDRRWRDLVEPALAALRTLPAPDEPRAYVARHDLTVLRRV